jgi:hypothetical protein
MKIVILRTKAMMIINIIAVSQNFFGGGSTECSSEYGIGIYLCCNY